MAVRLTSNFYDINGVQLTVDIHDADYVGSAVSFDTKSLSISYDSSDNDDFSSPIIGSRAKVGIVVPVGNTDLETFITDFAGGEEGRFTIEIGKVSGPAVVWRGILTPDFSGEEDTAPLYVFTVSAICGLALLKKKPYHDGSAIYTGIERLITHLVTALVKLPHIDTFWGASDAFVKTSVDWWSVSMSSGAADDSFYQGGVDHAAFYDYKTQGDVDKDVLSSYDVIWHILKTFECRILQIDGAWVVEQISYRTASPYVSRSYSKTAGYLSNTTNSGANIINQTSSGAKLATANYDFLPSLASAEVEYDVKTRRNFLAGTNIVSGPSYNANFDQAISSNNGTAIGRLKFTLNWTVGQNNSPFPLQSQYYIVPLVTLKIGANYLKRTYTISNFSAQLSALSWDTSGNIAVPIFVGTIPLTGFKQGTVDVDLILPAIPADGDQNTFGATLLSFAVVRWDGVAADSADFTMGCNITNQFLTIYDEGTPAVTEDKILYIATNPATSSEKYQTKVRLGSADLPNSAGRLLRWNGSAWVDAGNWGQGVDARTSAIGDILAKNILNSRDTPRRRLNGTLYGDFNIRRLISTSDGRKWMMSNATWDLGRNTISGTWFELEYGGTGVSSTPVKIKLVPPNKEPTVGSGNPSSPGVGISNSAPGFYSNPPPTVLAPVSYNQLGTAIDEGDTVTSIPIKTASLGNEFLAGDGVTIVNPATGVFQTFEIATAPTVGATSLSVVSEVSNYDFPEDSYLVVKQNAYAFSLPTATQGQILRFNATSGVWEAYSGTTDGHVLTWDTTNGWQAEAAAGGGLADGDYGDISVSGGGTVLSIDAGVVDTNELANFAVTTVKLASDSVTFVKIVDGAVITAKIADLNVTTGKLADGAVTTVKITDLNVTTGKLADGAVTTVKITDLNVTTEKLNTAAVTTAKIADQNVTTGKLADLAVTTGKIADAAVTTVKIADANVTTAKIADDAVTYAKLQNVSTTNRVLGRITAGAGNAEELTPANLYTLLSITGSADRVPYFTGTNAINSTDSFKYLNGTKEIMIGNGASLDARYSHREGGTFGGDVYYGYGLISTTNSYIFKLENTRNQISQGTTKIVLQVGGANAADPFIEYIVASASNNWTAGVDNSDSDKFKITPKSTAPGSVLNSGLIITSEAIAKIGINKDAPIHPLDVEGLTRSRMFIGKANEWVIGDFAAGTALNGGGAITGVTGCGNGFSVSFSTGTTPAANGNIFVCTYPAAVKPPFASYPTFSSGSKTFTDEGNKFYVSASSATSFTFTSSGTLTAGTEYKAFFCLWGSNNTA